MIDPPSNLPRCAVLVDKHLLLQAPLHVHQGERLLAHSRNDDVADLRVSRKVKNGVRLSQSRPRPRPFE